MSHFVSRHCPFYFGFYHYCHYCSKNSIKMHIARRLLERGSAKKSSLRRRRTLLCILIHVATLWPGVITFSDLSARLAFASCRGWRNSPCDSRVSCPSGVSREYIFREVRDYVQFSKRPFRFPTVFCAGRISTGFTCKFSRDDAPYRRHIRRCKHRTSFFLFLLFVE